MKRAESTQGALFYFELVMCVVHMEFCQRLGEKGCFEMLYLLEM